MICLSRFLVRAKKLYCIMKPEMTEYEMELLWAWIPEIQWGDVLTDYLGIEGTLIPPLPFHVRNTRGLHNLVNQHEAASFSRISPYWVVVSIVVCLLVSSLMWYPIIDCFAGGLCWLITSYPSLIVVLSTIPASWLSDPFCRVVFFCFVVSFWWLVILSTYSVHRFLG